MMQFIMTNSDRNIQIFIVQCESTLATRKAFPIFVWIT